MPWSTAQARRHLADVIEAADREPQVITRRGKPVAVVMDVEQYDAFVAWQRSEEVPLAGLVHELMAAASAASYTLEVPPRRDRADPFDEQG